MRFSVVIPLYNKAASIDDAIGSALAQTFPVHEVLVVDDGSTDGSGERVARLRDPRVRLLRQANAGVSAARNHGIARATGDWVVFLDADDWHHPQLLHQLARAALVDPEAAVIGTGYQLFDGPRGAHPTDWPVDAEPLIEPVRDLYARWMRSGPFFTSSVAIRTALLRQLPGFPVGEHYGEDLDLWFRAAEHGPVLVVRAPLAAYHRTLTGLSASNPPWVLAPYLVRLRARIRAGEVPAALRRSALRWAAHQELTAARAALAHGRPRDALRLIRTVRPGLLPARWTLTALRLALHPLLAAWPGAAPTVGSRS